MGAPRLFGAVSRLASFVRTSLVAGAVVAVGTSALAAQVSIAPPPISGPKNAATRAAEAVNARTDAATRAPAAEQQAGARPAQPAPQPQKPTPGGTAAGAAKRSGAADVAATRPGNESGMVAAAAPAAKGGKELSLMREAFAYEKEGRRDPFMSLLATGELRPMIADLRLVTILFDPSGKSVAILRDVSTKEQYRVKVGQVLGRMRVAQITNKNVVFTIEEFGYSRQEVLGLEEKSKDPTKK